MLSNPVIGDKVFGFLHLKDLKSAALVCRDFKTFLDCRKFWRQAEIRIRQDVLSSDRIQNIGNFVVDRKTGARKTTTGSLPNYRNHQSLRSTLIYLPTTACLVHITWMCAISLAVHLR